jgi:hypothetical protein
MMAEKRKHKRAEKYFAVNIVSVDINGKVLRFDKSKANPKFHDESGLNFSPDGINIMCSKPLPAESRIQMKMLIPEKDKLNLIKANGTIKWFREIKGKYKKYFVIGVHFRDMEERDKDKLVRLWKKYYKD